MKKNAAIVIIILVSISLGILIGTKIKKTPVPQGAPTNTQNTYQAGWDAAREKIAKSPQGMMIQSSAETKSISGTVQKIDGNKIIIKALLIDPLADQNLETRIIDVDSNTKIVINTQKDSAQFQKEMQAFQESMKNQASVDQTTPREPIMPPTPFEQKEIKVSDLKENQQISVTANDVIGDKNEFAAAMITAQENSVVPAPVQPTPDTVK